MSAEPGRSRRARSAPSPPLDRRLGARGILLGASRKAGHAQRV